jgi:hypothetical protein
VRAGSFFLGGLLAFGLTMAAASSAAACSTREPADREAAWAAYRSEARTIFVGRVVALHPYSRAERRELDETRIAGSSYGTRAGWADIAPVELTPGASGPVRARYSNGHACGRDLWNARLGDFVLVVVGPDGFADIRWRGELEDPVLRAQMQSYW